MTATTPLTAVTTVTATMTSPRTQPNLSCCRPCATADVVCISSYHILVALLCSCCSVALFSCLFECWLSSIRTDVLATCLYSSFPPLLSTSNLISWQCVYISYASAGSACLLCLLCWAVAVNGIVMWCGCAGRIARVVLLGCWLMFVWLALHVDCVCARLVSVTWLASC